MSGFSHLFQPLKIRGMQTPNRVLMPAMGSQMGQGGKVSETQINYYAARARGGVGLIITEAMSVHPSDTTRFNAVNLWDDATRPSLRALTDAVHRYGTPILCQLHHGGGHVPSTFTLRAPLAPSPLPELVNRDVPHEMDASDIREITEAFHDAFRLAITL